VINQKIFWFDVETTGLDPNKQEIVKLAFEVEIDQKLKEHDCICIRPENILAIMPQALETNKLTMDQIMKFPPATEGYKKIIKTLDHYVDKYDKTDKLILAGYNVNFDIGFFRSFFTRQNNSYFGSYFFAPPLDVYSLVSLNLRKGLRLNNYRLETVCDYFGIKIIAHDPESDISATRELFKIFLQMERDCITPQEYRKAHVDGGQKI
jgi:DNA polymerase-3 subunit epsilon